MEYGILYIAACVAGAGGGGVWIWFGWWCLDLCARGDGWMDGWLRGKSVGWLVECGDGEGEGGGEGEGEERREGGEMITELR